MLVPAVIFTFTIFYTLCTVPFECWGKGEIPARLGVTRQSDKFASLRSLYSIRKIFSVPILGLASIWPYGEQPLIRRITPFGIKFRALIQSEMLIESSKRKIVLNASLLITSTTSGYFQVEIFYQHRLGMLIARSTRTI